MGRSRGRGRGRGRGRCTCRCRCRCSRCAGGGCTARLDLLQARHERLLDGRERLLQSLDVGAHLVELEVELAVELLHALRDRVDHLFGLHEARVHLIGARDERGDR